MKSSLLVVMILLAGCASSSSRSGNSTVVKTPQVLQVEKKMKAREEAAQDQKDRNRVLAQKRKTSGASSGLAVTARPQNKKVHIGTLTGQQANISERDLYAQLVAAYDANEWIGFESRYQLFREKYARSILSDEVLYLGGLFQLSNKNYGQSLSRFNEILKKYPNSNKTASAQFAKGIALKRMKLLNESEAALKKVQSQFPGSPEANRAEAELKILRR